MIMRKYIYVISVLLFAAIGCTKEYEQNSSGDNVAFPEGATALVTFSIPAQPQTRTTGMAVEPEIENLYVAVFNSAGLLKEYVEATPVQLATTNATWYTYQVALQLNSSERRLHFIANAPESIPEGTESAVIRSLETADGNAAYWQRVILEHGVTPFAYPGGVFTYKWTDESGYHEKTYGTSGGTSYVDGAGFTVNKGDYVQQNGNKVTDGTGYWASTETTSELAKVPLIRNFARITVTGKEDGTFEPIQFKTIYTPDKGYVAPYDAHADAFVAPYLDAYDNTSTPTTMEAYTKGLLSRLKASGYRADMPTDATLSKLTKTEVEGLSFLEAGQYDFMYERGLPDADAVPTCVLVQGYLTDRDPQKKDPRWFKIEINDTDGNYLPIFRDVTYNMEIASIMGTPGWKTAWEAYDNLSVGDVSTSTTTETLNQISDGKNPGTTLWVEYIDLTSVKDGQTTVTILYKLFTDTGENLTSTNVTLRVDSFSATTSAAITDTSISGEPYSGTNTPDGLTGWYVANVHLAAPGESVKKSYLHIEGVTKFSAQKALFRNVLYRVMPKQELTLNSSYDSDGDLNLSIHLPEELGFSMFPLVLKIEANKGDLNPAVTKNTRANVFGDTDTATKGKSVDLPTEYGKSLFVEDPDYSGPNSFYFLFTVNYSDYSDYVSTGVTYNLYFKKTRNTDNSTAIRVQDKEPFFKVAKHTL